MRNVSLEGGLQLFERVFVLLLVLLVGLDDDVGGGRGDGDGRGEVSRGGVRVLEDSW